MDRYKNGKIGKSDVMPLRYCHEHTAAMPTYTRSEQDFVFQYSIMEGEGAEEATPLSEELLEVSGCQELEEDIFFSGVGTGELAML